MEQLFDAKSIAVIGVSESEDNLGRNIVGNLVRFGYRGQIHAVGPRGGRVLGRTIHRSVADLPEVPELAVILTPARFVPGILAECAERGTRRAVIESGGFRELGPEGEVLERELLETSKRYGVRFAGPNGIGIVNTANGLYTPFIALPSAYRKGKVAVFAQSGGMGLSLGDRLSSSGVGISKLVSIGNKLNLDETDYLSYLIDDPNTEVIYLYLEDFKRGRRFAEIARTSTKPIVLHKSNTSGLSRTIAQSHTAALAADDAIVDAVCRECGILRVHSVSEAITALRGLCLPVLKGHNLAVVSRSGGHAVVAADACARHGFHLPPLDQGILDEARRCARAGVVRFGNPMDLGDIYDIEFYFRTVERAIRQEDVHGVVFMQVSHMIVEREGTRRLVERLARLSVQYDKPVAIVIEVPLEERVLQEKTSDFPFFLDTAEAVEALAFRYRYAGHAARSVPQIGSVVGSYPPEAVRGWVDTFDKEKRQPLFHEALDLLERLGIPSVPWSVAGSLDEARAAAEQMGYPVVLKAVSPFLLHKSDRGAIALNIRNTEDLERHWRRLCSISADIETIVVQKMASASREIIIGGKRDPSFGPVVLAGLGGVMVEVIQDVSMRLAPVTADQALDMIHDLRGGRILGSFRGMPEADLRSLAAAIVKVSSLMHDFPQVKEVDINPMSVDDAGGQVLALDARVILGDSEGSS